ncbi:MAG: outer membrane beta-barrel protein [Desulfohalobiaceae bacterium]|nr:outer membrane beta-barrel protein [Desulfohalobiaceae bacterium]
MDMKSFAPGLQTGWWVPLFLVLAFGFTRDVSLAGVQVTVTPSLSTSAEYDDNIFLDEDDTESDMLFIVSPGIGLALQSKSTSGSLSYTPSKVYYKENSRLDNWRHSANLSFRHAFNEFFSFGLQDTFLLTDDPLAEDIRGLTEEEIKDRTRQGRNEYWRNNLSGSFDYQFGPGKRLSAGYTYNILEEENDAEDDARERGPFVNLSYRLDDDNSLRGGYRYQEYEYEREDGTPAREDIEAHNVNVSYVRKIDHQTSANLGYGVSTRDYDGDRSDYMVHDVSVGVRHAFSEHFSGAVSVGYFYQDEDDGGDSEGYTFRGSLNRSFEYCSIGLSAEHGWDEDFLDRTPEGFTKYWRFSANWSCTPYENLRVFANLSYRMEDDENRADENILTAQAGISRSFWRWYALSLRYLYRLNESDRAGDDYTDNRVVLSVSFSRPYNWVY